MSDLIEAEAIAAPLTAKQMRALRWLADEQHHRSRWMVKGRSVRREPPEEWTHMEIAGDGGRIVIHKDDMRAIHPYIVAVGTPQRLWDVTPEGRAILAGGAA